MGPRRNIHLRFIPVQQRRLYGDSRLPVRLNITPRMPRCGKDAGQPTDTAQPDPCIRLDAKRHPPLIARVSASRCIPTLHPNVLLRLYAASQRPAASLRCHIASQSLHYSVKSPFPFAIARSEGRSNAEDFRQHEHPRQSLDSTVLLRSAPRSYARSNDIVYLAAQWLQ